MPTIYHTYANLNQFRDYLAGTQYSSNWTSDAVTLRRILQSASRRMDDYVGGGLLTTWGPYTQSREYDIGTGTLVDDPRNFVPVNSLAPKDQLAGIIPLGSWCNSITSVTSYTQTDRAESESLSPGYNADYWEIPYSTDPKYAIKINEDSQKTLFNAGQGTLVIAASWGWQNVTKSVTTITANITTTTATTVALTSVDDVAEGSTILIGTEQMYVESISSLNATVIRGVHGTTAATHTSGDDVSTIQYPEDVIQTCLDIGHVIYRDRDIGFSDRLENSTSVDMRNSLANLDGYKSHSNTAGAVF